MSLIAQDVYKIYKNGSKEIRAVNGISLEVEKGMALAIIGPSGAGKSTLLHLLGGLDRPTSGDVLLDGADIYNLSDKERAEVRNEKVGFVFQFYHLLPEFTALENVMLPGMIRRSSFVPRLRSGRILSSVEGFVFRRSEIKERAEEILKSVGLEDRMNHKPSELSGGESQRVAIARALVNEPETLLCDEPTGNLDSKTSESIYDLLFDLKSETDMTLLIVTHDESISSRVKKTIHIRDGRIV